MTPNAVTQLAKKGIPVVVEKSKYRYFPDEEYAEAGARLSDSLEGAELVLGIKEPAREAILPDQVHVAFSHTIKGQAYNMPLLQEFIDKKATLIDYEVMRDKEGTRTIAFGRYAGIAGAIDTFNVVGRKLSLNGIDSNLSEIEPTYKYDTIANAKHCLGELPPITGYPLKVLINGTGNVGGGCVEVCEWLGLERVTPEDLLAGRVPEGNFYCQLATVDTVRRIDGGPFDSGDYRKNGKKAYESKFHEFLGSYNVLLQTIYWDDDYPKQLPRSVMQAHKDALPIVIGDISCDIDGSLECTKKASTIDEPAFTYFVDEDRIEDGISWYGPSVMSIDHLPCELSRDASEHFSRILTQYMPELVRMDLNKPFEECGLERLLREATIVYRGELTPAYRYLEDCLANQPKEPQARDQN